MDPLTISASIITVLQATNAVISICYDYSAATKDSSWELPRLTEEVKGLRNILEALEQLAKKPGSADPAADSQLPVLAQLCEPNVGTLAMCLIEMEALEKELSPPSWSGQAGSKRRALVQALGWPLKERDTKRILERIGRFKATLNLAVTADQAVLTCSIWDKTRAIHDTTQNMQENFAKLHQSMTIGDQRKKILVWLSPPDPSSNHNEACKKRQAKTGTWFVGGKRFAGWKTNLNSFLWLHGIPGCGKTILTSTIIEDVLQYCRLSHLSAVVYFYFDFNDPTKKRHEKMIRSILAQLSIQSANASRALESLFCSCMNGRRQPTTCELLESLRQSFQAFDETFIILDALDECEERRELLEDIETFAGWRAERLHILATSRREKEIEERIEPLTHDKGRICIQSTLVNDDIRAYTQERIRTDWGLKRWQKKPEVQQEIEKTLVDKAGGMFRWAACQLDALRNCFSLPMLRKALASLPKTLDDTYARILCGIDEEHSVDALKILQWLAYSARPLQIKEVAEVIAVDIEDNPRFGTERRFPEPRDILKICSGLVAIVTEEASDGNEQVKLAHFSVKEYLVSERIQIGPACRYSIREAPANISIAEACLAYLLHFEHSDSLTSRTIKEYPLARYAAQYWTQHARWAEKDASAVHPLIMELFLYKKDAYVNWIQLCDSPTLPTLQTYPDIMGRSNVITPPLYYASLAGLVETGKLLLGKGANVNAQGGYYGNALQAASLSGHDRIVQHLLEKGANVNAQGGLFGNALQAASVGGHDQIVQQLLEKGADPNIQNGEYGSALQAASHGGRNQIVQQLLEKGANVNSQGGYFGNALQAASCRGHDKIVQQLLKEGADTNTQGGRYGNALQAASCRGHDQIVQQLLEKGADVNSQGGEYGNALQAASCRGHDQIVQLLLEEGANVNSQEGYFGNALQAASIGGHDQIVQQLLARGADVNAQGGHYGNALQAASYRGHSQTVQQLLEKGADVNSQGGEYGNALQAASCRGHDQIVQLLLEEGANVNSQEGYFGNALQAASIGGHDQIVQQLLARGADVNAQGGHYGNALQAASRAAHDQIVRQLLKKGADVNSHGGEFGDALQAASRSGHDQIVQQLLEKGANVNSQGGYHGNALQAASSSGHDQVVQQLLEGGANANAQGGYFGNALQAASNKGHDQVVQQLLEGGANANAQGGHFGNALQAASYRGHDQIVQQLLEKGADANAQGGYYGNALQAASVKGHDHIIQRLQSAIQLQ